MAKKRMTKAQRARLEEQQEIERSLEEMRQRQEIVEKGNEHSDMLASILKGAGRLVDHPELQSADCQTLKYGEATDCSRCGRPWGDFCGCAGVPHNEPDFSPAASPWRCNRIGSPLAEIDVQKSPKRKASKRRSLPNH
eukprot:TRINITY_DN6634_c1_g1_i1.p1 TRINITY_DN6634_c1_g1~~TRINITY_DN6634_c1_g1_i1.p1  ORF type:complete len:138 (+),score=30.53 TRINITY_DN6634_c1_g1_i1:42-455(+)